MGRIFTRIAQATLSAALLMGFAVTAASAEPQITGRIDETQLVTLGGNTRPEVRTAADLGAVAANQPLAHMQLQLRRSAAAEQDAQSFVESLTDPASSNYHQWLTAAQFGSRFGVDAADIAAVEAWLTGHGFTVAEVAPGHMVIDFSGTAGQVAAAFHTQIHALDVAGKRHIANIQDPAIPAALAPVVAGVTSLHDFRPTRKHQPRPDFTTTGCNGPCYPMAPGDLATIYHIASVYQAGISGQGQTIAVLEDSDLFAQSDFTNFRQVFGLASAYPSGNIETVHPGCSDPGVNSNGDDIETTLDVEWASAAAPSATIMLAACDNTQTTDGIFLAASNLVNSSSPPPIISISYGDCEADNGAAFTASFNSLYQQAVAEGISVFVATGDNGPSDCAQEGNGTTLGIGINAWAASAYDVAVGGTDFSDTYAGTNGQYWSSNSSSDFASALSYVPEMAWNDTCGSTLLADYVTGSTVTYGTNGFCNISAGKQFLLLGGGEGGPSACFSGNPSVTDVVSGSCKGNAKPSFQAGLFGNPADGVRDIPDVSLFAADGVWSHYYLLCFTDTSNNGGTCDGNPADWPPGGGGTSYATPILAGIQALVNQKTGEKQGNPNPTYYRLAAAEFGSSGNANCNANLGASVSSSCVFNDVTQNNTSQPCTGPYDCYDPSGQYGVLSVTSSSYSVAYNTGSGWDFATGIGTVNVANLVANWGGTTSSPASLVAAVLPGSRSVEVGATATVFGVMLNSGTTTLTDCQIALSSGAPSGLTLAYQQTNASNQLIGSPNTPATIAGNGSQNFLLSFKSTKAFSVTSMPLVFSCTGSQPAPSTQGVNTVDLLFSSTAIPDIIALAAVAGGNGIVTVPYSTNGAAAFAVDSIDVGTAGTLKVQVDTGSVSLPLTVTVCPTNPSTAACLSPPVASFQQAYQPNASQTYSVFVSASGPVTFAPATARIFLRFLDSSGASHGSTSVAVETD